MKPLSHLSLFTGIGGLDIAAEWAGFQTVGQCEWAEYQTKVLEKNFPGVPRWKDIRSLTKESFYEKTGLRTADLVSGGFPCQPFSLAGKRGGVLDDRYLWTEMLRVIHELNPTWVFGENVAGLLSMAQPDCEITMESKQLTRMAKHDTYEAVYSRRERMLLIDIIESLEAEGYNVQTLAIPACGVGAWHKRERVQIIGCRADRHADKGNEREERELSQRTSSKPSGGSTSAYPASIGRETNCDIPQISGEAIPDAPERKPCGADSIHGSVPDTNDGLQAQQAKKVRAGRDELVDSGVDVPHSDGRRSAVRGNGKLSEAQTDGDERDYIQEGAAEHGSPQWWAAEPSVGRVAYGIPYRVDRLECLGNAVVPQWAYPTMRAIAVLEGGQT